jgi:hypothetical protein
LNTAKQPTSRGCSRCDECGGIHSVMIEWSLQYWSNSVVACDSCLSSISRRYAPMVRGLVYGLNIWVS